MRFKDLKLLLQKAGSGNHTANSEQPNVVPAKGRFRRDPCIFWASGKCTKGVNCTFLHDPEIVPENQDTLRRECDAAIASMNLSLAHCAAMLGRWVTCTRSLKCAQDFYADNSDFADLDGEADSHGLFQQLSLEEARRELQRISDFCQQEDPPELFDYLCRTFLFSLTQSDSLMEESDVPQTCVNELLQSFGLGEVLRRSGMAPEDALQAFRKNFSKAQRLRCNRIFADHRAMPCMTKPVKLEICSGNGDWVIAQAKAEQGIANWIALELRHDRVHNIFSRMVFEKVENLCLLRGDASQVVPRHLQQGSVSHVFINFPEPPHFSGHESAESKNELLTASFFEELHSRLTPAGKMTILSDNWRYIQRLARTISKLHDDFSERLFVSSAETSDADKSEILHDIRVICGKPGKRVGHIKKTTSYFDRLWAKGDHVDRYYFMVERHVSHESDLTEALSLIHI